MTERAISESISLLDLNEALKQATGKTDEERKDRKWELITRDEYIERDYAIKTRVLMSRKHTRTRLLIQFSAPHRTQHRR